MNPWGFPTINHHYQIILPNHLFPKRGAERLGGSILEHCTVVDNHLMIQRNDDLNDDKYEMLLESVTNATKN